MLKIDVFSFILTKILVICSHFRENSRHLLSFSWKFPSFSICFRHFHPNAAISFFFQVWPLCLSLSSNNQTVGRNTRIASHWWTLFECHLFWVSFCIYKLNCSSIVLNSQQKWIISQVGNVCGRPAKVLLDKLLLSTSGFCSQHSHSSLISFALDHLCSLAKTIVIFSTSTYGMEIRYITIQLQL